MEYGGWSMEDSAPEKLTAKLQNCRTFYQQL